jgi:hypothetical protein
MNFSLRIANLRLTLLVITSFSVISYAKLIIGKQRFMKPTVGSISFQTQMLMKHGQPWPLMMVLG